MVKKESDIKKTLRSKTNNELINSAPEPIRIDKINQDNLKIENQDKYKNKEGIQNSQNTSLTRKLLLTVAILSTFIALISLGSYTGEITFEERFLLTESDYIEQFKVIDIFKEKDSVLSVDYESNIITNLYAEIGDCHLWKQGRDNDNNVLFATTDVKNTNFELGNINQQLNFYKTDNLCLILINKEYPKKGKFTIIAKETI